MSVERRPDSLQHKGVDESLIGKAQFPLLRVNVHIGHRRIHRQHQRGERKAVEHNIPLVSFLDPFCDRRGLYETAVDEIILR